MYVDFNLGEWRHKYEEEKLAKKDAAVDAGGSEVVPHSETAVLADAEDTPKGSEHPWVIANQAVVDHLTKVANDTAQKTKAGKRRNKDP